MKHLETVKLRQEFEAGIQSQMETIKRSWMDSTDEHDRANFNTLYNELNEKWLYSRQSKEWLYNFKSGGWNSAQAADKETAIKKAKEEWKNSTSLVVDESSFRVSTPKDYNQLMSLFY